MENNLYLALEIIKLALSRYFCQFDENAITRIDHPLYLKEFEDAIVPFVRTINLMTDNIDSKINSFITSHLIKSGSDGFSS